MATHLTGIDHVVILVNELAGAGVNYERFGFKLSPRGVHSEHMGTHNYTIMLQEDYFELLSVLAPTPNNQRWRESVAKGEGAGAMAFQTDDADKAQAEIRGLGLAASEIMAFTRPVDLPDGSKTEARFRVTQLPEDAVPGLALFVCGQLTRDAVWIPELTQHPNTAQAILEVVALAGDPAAAAEPWKRILGAEAISEVDGGLAVQIRKHKLLLLTPEAVQARYPGVAIPEPERDRILGLVFAVADFSACHKLLHGGNVPHGHIGMTGFVIAPADANGTLIELRKQAA